MEKIFFGGKIMFHFYVLIIYIFTFLLGHYGHFQGNATGLSTTVNNLEPNKLYVVHIISWNTRGSSLPNNDLNVTLSSKNLLFL